MSKRLWDKGEKLDEKVHLFTVGNDPELDRELVHWDALGSAAHAQMLSSVGILTKEESETLLSALNELIELNCKGEFKIPVELEDCHTAIEDFLAKRAGLPGLKIHTGRSRNDQVILAVRLYMRHQTIEQLKQLSRTCHLLLDRIDDIGDLPMPGYTHMQPAMPSSVGMWLHAFAEAFLEMIHDGLLLLEQLDQNPLGAASGFGCPLPLDRSLTAELLGFSKVQRNPVAVQNSRGRIELKFVRWCVDIAGIIEKFSWDMILYSTEEYGFFSLPNQFTTGSSIMPQKKNPDVLELLRAQAAKVRSSENELLWVSAKLPSNYHRDLQYTKEPLILSVQYIENALAVVQEVISSFSANKDTLAERMTEDLYATYDVYREVMKGVPFRTAYQNTAKRVKKNEINKEELKKDFAPIAQTLQEEVSLAKTELSRAVENISAWVARCSHVEENLFKNG